MKYQQVCREIWVLTSNHTLLQADSSFPTYDSHIHGEVVWKVDFGWMPSGKQSLKWSLTLFFVVVLILVSHLNEAPQEKSKRFTHIQKNLACPASALNNTRPLSCMGSANSSSLGQSWPVPSFSIILLTHLSSPPLFPIHNHTASPPISLLFRGSPSG